MITYPESNYAHTLSTEMLERTKDLPPYLGGPAIDYTEADHAYALNATLLYDPLQMPDEILTHGASSAAQILLVERASGHGKIGSFSGVSGYIDTLRSPADALADVTDVPANALVGPVETGAPFDPIAYTLREELVTECGFTDSSFELVDFYAGAPTVEQRTFRPGAVITVVPILGLCVFPPKISINPKELASYQWVDLQALRHVKDLAEGYVETTLPAALGALSLTSE